MLLISYFENGALDLFSRDLNTLFSQPGRSSYSWPGYYIKVIEDKILR
jgi:hypothetical protein